ncbi:MAG TPA: hypothetical protein PL045_08885, partial [Chitinophagaceae bacterium]|nr:hypothetical protein [Chitinophagaceae bacterium]
MNDLLQIAITAAVSAGNAMNADTHVHGYCDPRFAPLRDAFAENFAEGLEIGASLALTHCGETVVDL